MLRDVSDDGFDVHVGDETYVALKATMAQMFKHGHLSEEVTVTRATEGSTRLQVRWHLCADFKLVSLVTGLGGVGSSRPCFLCTWERSKPSDPGEARSAEGTSQHTDWAVTYLQPIAQAEAKIRGHPAGAAELPQLRTERDAAVSAVKAKIAALPPSDPLLQLWSNGSWLHQLSFTLPGSQFEDCTRHPALTAVAEELEYAWEARQKALNECNRLQLTVEECRERAQGYTEYQQQLPMYGRVVEELGSLEKRLDEGMLLLWRCERCSCISSPRCHPLTIALAVNRKRVSAACLSA